MQAFEFVMVVISIIVALGVAELLAGVARILRGELRFYWVHAIWVLNLLVLQLQYCWSLFDMAGKEDWVFLDLVRLVTPPILLFLISSLLFPSRLETGGHYAGGQGVEGQATKTGAGGPSIDLETFYMETRKPVFGLLGLLMVYYTVLNRDVSGVLFMQILAIAMLIALFVTEDRRLNAGLTFVYALGTMFFVVSFSYRLGESAF